MNKFEVVPAVPAFSAIILALAAGLFLLSPAYGAEVINAEEWNISADKMIRYENPPSIIAEGNVILEKIRKSTQEVQKKDTWGSLLGEAPAPEAEPETVTTTKTLTTIKADWVAYDIDQGMIRARGNLFIGVGTDQLTASQGRINLNDETGVFEDATIVSKAKKVHLEGKVIEKTGDLTYRIQDGWVITCKLKEGQAPPWSFAAKDADLTEGGYAILKHTTFRIRNIPVLYSPWMIVPVKNTRQTGFLVPSASVSDRDGFGINLPFFFNLSPSSDLTVYPEYLSERGFHPGLEYRYMMARESKGIFMGNYLHDDLSDPAEVEYYREGNYTHTNKDRYWLRAKADHDFAGWIARLDLDVVSDRDYLVEFTSGLTGYNASQDEFLDIFGRGLEPETFDERQNTLRLLRSWENSSLQAELLGVNDVRQFETSPTPLWKLPSVLYTGLIPVDDTLIDFSWNTSYVNYWREDGVGAHRFDIYPRLSAPVPLGDYLEARASVAVRDTFYAIDSFGDSSWSGNDTENRFLYEANAEVATTLIRDYGINMENVQTWRHTLRPFIGYAILPEEDQSDLPEFDAIDRIEERNLISYGVDNFFKIYGTRNGRPYERNFGYIKITQGYDLRSEEEDTPWTPISVRTEFYPLEKLRLVYRTEYGVHGEGALNYSFEGGYQSNRGDSVIADYRYDKLQDINSVSFNAQVNLLYNFKASYMIERSLENSITVEENIALVYAPACWSVQLSSHKTPDEQKFMLIFRLANIGNPFGIDLPGF